MATCDEYSEILLEVCPSEGVAKQDHTIRIFKMERSLMKAEERQVWDILLDREEGHGRNDKITKK